VDVDERATVAIVGERDVVSVSGGDAATFLQGQLSADVLAVGVGGAVWSLLLEPQGRVTAWLRVWRVGESAFVLDVDSGWGDRVVTRLRRFLLRVEVELVEDRWSWVGLRGADAAAQADRVGGAELSGPVDWRGLPGVDVLGPDLTVPEDLAVLVPAAAEALRVARGWPAMGRELDDGVIPAEAGVWLVESSVSFTKGCYTGQELVARVDSRGSNTPRRLRGVVVDAAVPVGAEVVAEGEVRGTLSSVADVGGETLALSLLHRSVAADDAVDVRWAGGSATGRVVDLPVASSGTAPGAPE